MLSKVAKWKKELKSKVDKGGQRIEGLTPLLDTPGCSCVDKIKSGIIELEQR